MYFEIIKLFLCTQEDAFSMCLIIRITVYFEIVRYLNTKKIILKNLVIREAVNEILNIFIFCTPKDSFCLVVRKVVYTEILKDIFI